MEFDEIKTAVAFVAVVALATVALAAAPMGMTTQTVLMMVLPSMVVGGLIFLVIGVKYGEYRARQ